MPFQLRSLNIAHEWIRHSVTEGDTVIDATVGNGHDTLFLARLVGCTGSVVGVDIQADALTQTKSFLEGASATEGLNLEERVSLHLMCHSRLNEVYKGEINAAMFNLGYLPSSDKSIITQKDTTLMALDTCLTKLKSRGIITIVCYPSHEGGEQETEAVDDWAKALDPTTFSVVKMTPLNPRTQAPYLIGVQKRV